MSRKLILSLVALGTFASAVVAGSADAMIIRGNGNHGGHGGRLPPIHIVNHPHFHHHYRYVWRHDYVRPIGYVARVSEPGPCTCLTKEYTLEGQVVFKDLCTKEMAMAPVDGAPVQGGQNSDPNNFAGKTYQDYLAANPQAKPVDTQKN